MSTQWSKPKAVSDLDVGMGSVDMGYLLPSMSEIPEEFKTGYGKWQKIVDDWFFSGLRMTNVVPKEGVDKVQAIRHIKAILHSWSPKHEHKTAGVAYLMSLWFDVFEYEVNKE